MDDQRIKTKIVEKLLRKRVMGSHNKTIDTVVNWMATDEQGRARDLIDEMVRDPNVPVQRYGGTRDAIRITDVRSTVKYLDRHGGNVPFGFDEYSEE